MNRIRARVSLNIGDHVLIGRHGYAMPGDWYFGTVLWTDGAHVLINSHGIGGHQDYKTVFHMNDIRAAGDYATLEKFRRTASEKIAALTDKVHQAERDLSAARKAIWPGLDALAMEVEP